MMERPIQLERKAGLPIFEDQSGNVEKAGQNIKQDHTGPPHCAGTGGYFDKQRTGSKLAGRPHNKKYFQKPEYRGLYQRCQFLPF